MGAIYNLDDTITFIDYSSIDGSFHDSLRIKDLFLSVSEKYNLHSDFTIKFKSYKDILKTISALSNKDYNKMEEIKLYFKFIFR